MSPVEESPEEFLARFAAYRVEVRLYPEPWGSPLLEVQTPAGFVYAMDRGAPPAPVGEARVLFHGLARKVTRAQGKEGVFREGAAYRLVGTARPLEEGFYLLLARGLPVVVHWEGPMPEEAEVLLWPPLMLFRE